MSAFKYLCKSVRTYMYIHRDVHPLFSFFKTTSPPHHPRPTPQQTTHRATSLGLLVLPGVLTPSEAFLAVKHGASILKLFPSPAIPPGMVKSLRAVLPSHVQLLVSGAFDD